MHLLNIFTSLGSVVAGDHVGLAQCGRDMVLTQHCVRLVNIVDFDKQIWQRQFAAE